MKTDNELIAEFMGFTCCDTRLDRFWNPPGKPPATVDNWEYHTNHLNNFRTSWDWLMPVVEKMDFGVWTIRPGFVEFKSYTGELRPERQFCFNTSTADWQHPNDEIPFVWLVYSIAVEGIKWYNSQSSKPKIL